MMYLQSTIPERSRLRCDFWNSRLTKETPLHKGFSVKFNYSELHLLLVYRPLSHDHTLQASHVSFFRSDFEVTVNDTG